MAWRDVSYMPLFTVLPQLRCLKFGSIERMSNEEALFSLSHTHRATDKLRTRPKATIPESESCGLILTIHRTRQPNKRLATSIYIRDCPTFAKCNSISAHHCPNLEKLFIYPWSPVNHEMFEYIIEIKNVIWMLVKFEVYHDGEHWCARGIGIYIFAQGKSIDDLMENIKEAVGLHFEDLAAIGRRHKSSLHFGVRSVSCCEGFQQLAE